jgi:hypothetical protein
MIHQFDPVIYPRKIWITYDATVKELNEYFPEGDGCDRYFGEMSETVDAAVYFTRSKDKLGGCLLRFTGRNSMDMKNVSHESVHAANGIFRYCGLDADTRNDEAHAYLVGWIAKCCEEVKNKQAKK